MSLVQYTVRRGVDAETADGTACKIALVLIVHENGTEQTLAINEEMIRSEGEGVIEREVLLAAANPPDAAFKLKVN
jgi:hypothetical protein